MNATDAVGAIDENRSTNFMQPEVAEICEIPASDYNDECHR